MKKLFLLGLAGMSMIAFQSSTPINAESNSFSVTSTQVSISTYNFTGSYDVWLQVNSTTHAVNSGTVKKRLNDGTFVDVTFYYGRSGGTVCSDSNGGYSFSGDIITSDGVITLTCTIPSTE